MLIFSYDIIYTQIFFGILTSVEKNPQFNYIIALVINFERKSLTYIINDDLM